MATSVAFLPMLSRMALGDSGRIRSEVAWEPGQVVELPVPSEDRAVVIDVTTPGQQTENVPPLGGVQDKPRWSFARTLQEGVYRWTSLDKRFSGMLVVNPPGDEADLVSADVEALARETGVPTIVAPTAASLADQLNKQAEGTSLAPGILALVMILSILEALMANRYRPAAASARVVAAAAGEGGGGQVEARPAA